MMKLNICQLGEEENTIVLVNTKFNRDLEKILKDISYRIITNNSSQATIPRNRKLVKEADILITFITEVKDYSGKLRIPPGIKLTMDEFDRLNKEKLS
jgi:hypothetical protein